MQLLLLKCLVKHICISNNFTFSFYFLATMKHIIKFPDWDLVFYNSNTQTSSTKIIHVLSTQFWRLWTLFYILVPKFLNEQINFSNIFQRHEISEYCVHWFKVTWVHVKFYFLFIYNNILFIRSLLE